MIKKLLSQKWLVVFHVFLISLLSFSWASAHGGNTALIHACVNNTSGELKIVGANTNCPNNYRALECIARWWTVQAFAICANVAP